MARLFEYLRDLEGAAPERPRGLLGACSVLITGRDGVPEPLIDNVSLDTATMVARRLRRSISVQIGDITHIAVLEHRPEVGPVPVDSWTAPGRRP